MYRINGQDDKQRPILMLLNLEISPDRGYYIRMLTDKFPLRLLMAAVSIITISLVLACGGDGDSGRQVVLEYWQFWTDPEAKAVITELVNGFETAHPGIKVNVTDLTWGEGHSKIIVAFSGGNPPDIVELGSDWIPEFSSRGSLMDITDYVGNLLEERIMWEQGIYKNRYFAVPWYLDTRVIFYNKDLLREAGFHTDRYPRTWDELRKACEKINNLGPKISGFGANIFEKHRLYKKFLPFVWTAGGDVLDSNFQPVFDSPEVIEAFEYYLGLTGNGVMDNQRNLDQRFINGTLGFDFSGGWTLKNIGRNNPDLNFGVMPVPSPSGEMGVSFAGGEYLAISAGCRHPRQAFEFIEFMVETGNTIKLCKTIGSGFPGTKQLPSDPFYSNNPHLQVFHEQLLNSRMPPAHPKWVYIEEIVEKTVEKGMYKKGRPADLLKEANHEIERLLEPED
jgi:multiple sugar transport system substrate-binding protein